MAHGNYGGGNYDNAGGMDYGNNTNNQRQEVKGGFNDVADTIQDQPKSSGGAGRLGGAGLSLSSKAKRADALSKALKESGGSAQQQSNSNNNNAAASASQAQQQQEENSGNPVNLRIDEKISALLNREGGVSSLSLLACTSSNHFSNIGIASSILVVPDENIFCFPSI